MRHLGELENEANLAAEDHRAAEPKASDPGTDPGDTGQMSYCTIEPPMFVVSDDKLGTRIQNARRELDEKTRVRDSVKVKVLTQKITCDLLWRMAKDAADSEERKRRESDFAWRSLRSSQSTLRGINNELSIVDANSAMLVSEMRNLKHRVKHGRNTLRDEKELAKAISRLKQQGDQLSSDLDAKEKFQVALSRQAWAQNDLWYAKKRLDFYRDRLLQAERKTKAAKFSFDGESRCLRNLEAQLKAAQDLRRDAYLRWDGLNREFAGKAF